MILRVKNNLDINAPQTYTSYQEVAGTNIIRWKNPNGFNASWAVQIGATGVDQSEIVILGASTPAGTAGTLTGNTLYEHPADTPIYGIKYDQVVFEVSTTGTAGAAVPIASGTVTIQPDSQDTIFDHTTGVSTYAYKTYFRNSVLAVNSSESDWITSAGFSFYSLANIRQRVRDRFYNSDYIQNDSIIDGWTNEFLNMMNNAQIDVNEDYALGTTSIAFGGGVELGTITASDFRGGFKRVWYQDGSGTYTATRMDSNSFSPTRVFTNTYPYYYMQGDNIVGRKPFDVAGTFLVEYPKSAPILVNDADELPVPMKTFSKAFVDYGQGMALNKDNKHTEGQIYIDAAVAQLNLFKTQITPRNRTGATYVDIVESVADDGGMWF